MNKYSLNEVAKNLDIDESLLRFYERKFKHFFSGNSFQEIGQQEFSLEEMELLKKIHFLKKDQKFSFEDIEKEFSKDKQCITLAIASGKGGVGKTTIACNLAYSLACMNKRVLLFDADLGLSNVHVHLGINPSYNISHFLFGEREAADIVIPTTYGFDMVSGGSGVLELSNLHSGQRMLLKNLINNLKNSYDIIIFDIGAGLSDVVMGFIEIAQHLLVVTSADLAALTDAYALIKVTLQKEKQKQISALINFSKNEQDARVIFNRLNDCTIKFLSKELEKFYWLRRDDNVFQAIQQRKPMMVVNERAWITFQIKRIAQDLVDSAGHCEQKEVTRSVIASLA